MAVLMEHTDAITLLLKYGADVNMTNEKVQCSLQVWKKISNLLLNKRGKSHACQ